jgi:serine/threonine protein kinase
MNALAPLADAMQVPSLTGQSHEDAMLETDPHEPEPGRPKQVDTLSAEDGVVDGNLDDRLMHRDLKARLFGSEGRVTIGRYEVLRRIGRGGMGTVYVAHDPELDRKIALKVLRADRRSGRERMLHEARALARLSHPNVVAVHEVGLHDERVFVAMELVEGKTLRAWLEDRPGRTGIFEVFLQAARGLEAAHRAGLVHRDFKPDNVLIGDDGRVRVVDFGVAKAWGAAGDSLAGPPTSATDSLDPTVRPEAASSSSSSGAAMPNLTLTGQLLGTPAYMAPEQFLGAPVDARTDVFAFCVTLYEALTGRRPFDGEDTAAVAWSVLQGQARPLEVSDVPASITTLVEQGLSREADRRPASLEGLVRALEAALAPALALVPARPRRASMSRMAGAVVMATAIGGGMVLMTHSQGEPPDRPLALAAVAPAAVEDEAEAAAFATVVTASDDTRRHSAAEAYLTAYGQTGAATRRAVAHSIVGDVQWRASCATATLGLCLEPKALPPGEERCHAPSHGPFVRRAREEAKAAAALVHLDQALELAGVEPPKDEAERQLFATAIGRARVQRADRGLEEYLDLTVPTGLDFVGAKALSSDAFKRFYGEKSRLGAELMSQYMAVKKAQSPQWVLVGASRTGMLSEQFAATLTSAPLPPSVGDRAEYCAAIEGITEPALETARGAYAYCVDEAGKRGIELPEVGLCRERLTALGEAAPLVE